MKRKIICMVMAAFMLIGLCACGKDSESVKLEGSLQEIAAKIYENTENFEIAVGDAATIDLSDSDSLKYMLGLSSAEGIEEAVSSDALIMSIAYSMCLVRTQEGADVEKIKEDIFNGVDARKWICVAADKVLVANCGDVILMVMGDETTVQNVYSAFEKVSGNTASQYLIRDGE